MGFQKQGDVEKHEVVSPEDNAKLNDALVRTGKTSYVQLSEDEVRRVEEDLTRD